MKKKALFITTQFPFPAFSGGKLVSLQHLDYISKKYQTDVVCKASGNPDKNVINEFKQNYSINKLYIFEHWIKTNEHKGKAAISLLKSLWKREPFKIFKHYSYKTESKIQQLLEQNYYDLVVFDQLPSLQLSVLNKLKNSHLLFAHNAEFETVATQIKSQKSKIKRLFLNWELNKLKRYEQEVYKKVGNVIFLSKMDANQFSGIKNPLILPSYVNLFKQKKNKSTIALNQKATLFLVSSWSWALNKEGLVWFVDKVLPLVKSNIEVIIAGDGIDDKLRNKLQQNKRIRIIGRVDEVDSYYTNSHLAIIPLFGGSGIKIKVVDAMAHAIPIITTSFGIQGLEDFSDGVCVADNTVDFANHIHSLLENESIYKDHNKRIEKSYSQLQNQETENSLNAYLKNIQKH